jgi:hypothetical protein
VERLTERNFGLLIAFVLPGLVVLWGVSFVSPTVASWLSATPSGAPTVAGFLFVTLASVGAGLVASAVRWAVIDKIHHATGVQPPPWDFGRLDERLPIFLAIVENHYRFYQFYANMFVAVAFTYRLYLVAAERSILAAAGETFAFVLLQVILFAGSRDALAKYYARTGRLLGH